MSENKCENCKKFYRPKNCPSFWGLCLCDKRHIGKAGDSEGILCRVVKASTKNLKCWIKKNKG